MLTPSTYLPHARTRRGRTSPEAPFRMSGLRRSLSRWKSNRDQPNQPGQIDLARSHTSAIHVFMHGILRWPDGRVVRHGRAINRRNLLDNKMLKDQCRILTARSSGGTPRNLEPYYSKRACDPVRIDVDSDCQNFTNVGAQILTNARGLSAGPRGRETTSFRRASPRPGHRHGGQIRAGFLGTAPTSRSRPISGIRSRHRERGPDPSKVQLRMIYQRVLETPFDTRRRHYATKSPLIQPMFLRMYNVSDDGEH